MTPRGWIKICGITSAEDALGAVDAGADAIGINLWPGSPRCVSMPRARGIADAVRGRAAVVAVTVDARVEALQEIAATLRPTWLQLHGDETAALVQALPAAFKAIGLASQADVERAQQMPGPWVLIDAHDVVLRGGTGRAASTELARRVCRARPTFVAGGLTEINVAQTIEALEPIGVDTASGVESAPGIKDMRRVRAFVAAARGAWQELGDTPWRRFPASVVPLNPQR